MFLSFILVIYYYYIILLLACNVPDLASLGNVVNVYVGSIVYSI
jgi:hypothetical protein